MNNEIVVGDQVRLRDDVEREGYSLIGGYEDHPDAKVVARDGHHVVVDRQLDGALLWNVSELEKAQWN